MEEKIEITIKHVTGEKVGPARKLLYVEREITYDGDLVYSDHLCPELFFSATDNLSEFYNWLNNRGRYRRKVRTRRKHPLQRRLVAFFQFFPLRLKVLALRLKKFYLQKKVLLIKSFRLGS